MAKKKNSRSKFAEAIDPRFTGVVQNLKNEAKISNVPKRFFTREVNSDNNEAFQKYLRKRYLDYKARTIEFVEFPIEKQRNTFEFPKIEEIELLPGIPIIPPSKKKAALPPGVPILPQNSVIKENNGQDASPKQKSKKKTELPPGVTTLPQNSNKEANDGQEAPPKQKSKKKPELPAGVTILPQNSNKEENDEHDVPPKKKRKKNTESSPGVPILLQNSVMEENVRPEAPPKKKRKKKTELPPGVTILPQNSNKEENDEHDVPPKKKRKKEKVRKAEMTFDSDEALQKYLYKRWYDYKKSTIEFVELPLEQQRNKWEFPKIEEIELLPGIPIIPKKEEKDRQEAPPKKKRNKEKKKEKECFKEVAVTADWLEKQAKLYIS